MLEPEIAKRSCQPQVSRIVTDYLEDGERFAQVGVLSLEAPQPLLLLGPLQRNRSAFGKLDEIGGMALSGRLALTLLPELLEGELPHRLQHAVARFLSAPFDTHEVLRQQRAKTVEEIQRFG